MGKIFFLDVCGLMDLGVCELVHWKVCVALGAGQSRDVSSSAFGSPVYSEIPLVPAHTPAHGNAGTPPNTHRQYTQKFQHSNS